MKTRWIKSVTETSKQQTPALPFHRSARRAYKMDITKLVRPLKIA